MSFLFPSAQAMDERVGLPELSLLSDDRTDTDHLTVNGDVASLPVNSESDTSPRSFSPTLSLFATDGSSDDAAELPARPVERKSRIQRRGLDLSARGLKRKTWFGTWVPIPRKTYGKKARVHTRVSEAESSKRALALSHATRKRKEEKAPSLARESLQRLSPSLSVSEFSSSASEVHKRGSAALRQRKRRCVLQSRRIPAEPKIQTTTMFIKCQKSKQEDDISSFGSPKSSPIDEFSPSDVDDPIQDDGEPTPVRPRKRSARARLNDILADAAARIPVLAQTLGMSVV